MQITLVQSEIEQAITDYITQRVTLPAGTELAIDLNATRGETGFKAIINIVVAAEPVVPVTPIKRPIVATAATVAEDPVDGSVGGSSVTAEEASAPVEEEVVTEGAVAESAPPKSLFAGLNRPKNS